MLVYIGPPSLIDAAGGNTSGKPSCALHELHLRKGSQCSNCYASTQESDFDFVARHSYGQSDLVLAALQCLETSRDPSSQHSQDASSGSALH